MKIITQKDIQTAENDLARVRILLGIIKGEAKYRSGDEENE